MLFEFELLLLIVMIGSLLLLNVVFKVPVAIATFLAAPIATLVAGEGLPIRHLFEGTFGFLDNMIITCTGILFVQVVSDIGTISASGSAVIKKFHNRPVILVALMGMLFLIPGMLTGGSVISIVGVGSLFAPVLLSMGVPAADIGALLSICGTLAIVAPPINIPAMMIASSVDMSFQGFAGPLLFIAVTGAMFTVFWYCHKYLKPVSLEELDGKIDLDAGKRFGISVYFPVLLVAGWIAAVRIFPRYVPDVGLPLIFVVGAIVGTRCGRKCNLYQSTVRAIDKAIPLMVRAVATGTFIQVFTVLGVRSYLVGNCVLLPSILLMLATTIIMPLFGGISLYGSATLLGGPIILATLAGNEIILAAAASALAIMGQLLPPIMASPYYAEGVTKRPSMEILKRSIVPFGFVLLVCFVMMVFSNQFDFLIF